MAFFQFKESQQLNATLDEVWDFISAPQNLKEITPDYMGFDITSSDLPKKMHPGMIISYSVKPLLGIPTQWVTEITQVEPKKFFVDEQRVGPYQMWHHQHHIEEKDGGVLMSDIVSYQPPFGFIGSIANVLVIKSKLREIFDYRSQILEKKYNSK
ncbi:MAG: ligand-binding SRPBCC domain-containing protein [Salibacteraceae bacterium]|jgi:ligand-binding SRPBCC domain-containing protein